MTKNLLLSLGAAALLTACGTTESKMGMGTSLQDLPQPVQASVEQQIGNANILDIDKERRSGRDVYEITYQQSGGMKEKLHVAADGTILSQREAGARGLMHEASGANRESQPAAQGEYRSNAPQRENIGASNVDTSTSPAGATATYGSTSGVGQSSINAQSRDFSANAQADTSSSGASIQADTSKDASVTTDTSVSANDELAPQDRIEAKKEVRGGAEGLLQKGSVDAEANESAGAEVKSDTSATESSSSTKAAEIQSGTSSSSTSSELQSGKESAGAEVKATTTEDNQQGELGETHIKFNELPEAVKTTLSQHGGEAQIKEIDKKTENGRTVYEVEFKDSSKKEMKIAEDGTMVEENK